MHRFFVPKEQFENEILTIKDEDFKHISRVLRMTTGDQIEVCDGEGTDYEVSIQAIGEKSLTGKIVAQWSSAGENPDFEITLFQGLPKGTKMETIVQKNVELGVGLVYPFSSVRSVVDLSKKEHKKIERWQRIAYEAAKQSKRGKIPEIGQILKISDMEKKLADYDLILLAYEAEQGNSLKKVLTEFDDQKALLRIAVIIGPEGGFDHQEVEKLVAAGARSVSLGKRILRTETAGMAVVSQINFWKEII